jgi:hypothetical protein
MISDFLAPRVILRIYIYNYIYNYIYTYVYIIYIYIYISIRLSEYSLSWFNIEIGDRNPCFFWGKVLQSSGDPKFIAPMAASAPDSGLCARSGGRWHSGAGDWPKNEKKSPCVAI